MNKILVLFTCYNRIEKTKGVIETLMTKNHDIRFEFIVTDGGSIDGTREWLGRLDNVELVIPKESVYYSGGMRYAISRAKEILGSRQYDYVMLINDDVDFFEESISGLIKKAKENPCIWVGPACDTDGKLSYGGVIRLSDFKPKFKIIKSDSPEGKKCDTFNANCVLIPSEIFEKLDNMDEAYTHSLGDFDYGLMAGRKGYEIRVSDEFVGQCSDNPSKGTWRDKSLSTAQRIKLKESPKGVPTKEWFHYLVKNYNLITAVIYSVTGYVRIFLRR